jgi:hypothetical protein
MSSLINRSACKKAVLDAARYRNKFTRVGQDVFVHLNFVLINEIRKIVETHPSIGKTIMMGSKSRTKREVEETELI